MEIDREIEIHRGIVGCVSDATRDTTARDKITPVLQTHPTLVAHSSRNSRSAASTTTASCAGIPLLRTSPDLVLRRGSSALPTLVRLSLLACSACSCDL